MPHLRMVRCSMVRKMRFSTKSPIRMTVKSPANTFAISSRFLFSNTYQPRPPEPWLTPNTSSAAISVRQANAQPIFRPVRMFERRRDEDLQHVARPRRRAAGAALG